MSSPATEDVGTPATETPVNPPVTFHLCFQDTLAAGNRLWIRGQLIGSATAGNGTHEGRTWWKPWRKEEQSAPATLRLEARVSGSGQEVEVPIGAEGRFEARLSVPLPLARRAWLVAHNRVQYAAQVHETCNVVLLPPASAGAAVVVLLPLETTWPTDGLERLTNSRAAPRLAMLMRKLGQAAGPDHPVYYLACVPAGGADRHAELALAATALGWPPGHFVLLRTDLRDAPTAFATALDRLRWLFAGTVDLWALNLEPEAAPAVAEHVEPKEDRATVRELSDRKAGPCKVVDTRRSESLRTHMVSPRPARAALLPRFPIVFCHGMLAYSLLKMSVPEDGNYFSALGEFLRQRGFRVLFPAVAGMSGVVDRAEQLRDQILHWTDEPVNLVAHSMGGLDARYMITYLDMADRVRTLTTISTPHRGSYLADWFQSHFRERVPILYALETIGMNVDGFRDVRPEICRRFNAATPDQPKVRYFSFGGDVQPSHLTPFLRRAWSILTPVEGANDGLVSVTSARWGEYLGTLRADHFAQSPDGVFVRPGEDFDALGFYTRLVEDLARRGF
jgi:triacylglycerol lipase